MNTYFKAIQAATANEGEGSDHHYTYYLPRGLFAATIRNEIAVDQALRDWILVSAIEGAKGEDDREMARIFQLDGLSAVQAFSD